MLTITIKTFAGFEDILQEELAELGYTTTKLRRAVQLEGNWEDVYRLNYRCRLAISVLVKIEEFYIHNEKDLYKKAMKIDWSSYFDIERTFAVKGSVFSTLFRHTRYPMLLLKDAIADSFRDQFGKRPDVNPKTPQVLFDLYVKDKQATVSLNTSGKPLFQRGYRQKTGEAPMNEVLAAGILRLSGWDKKSTLINPMCGSGTIAIEAALWAADIPALVEREHFSFKNFKSYQPSLWNKIKEEAPRRPKNLDFDIIASDIDGTMVNFTRRNCRVAPIGKMIQIDRQDFLSSIPPNEKGTLICNPPYGNRIGEDIDELYQEMGDVFKNKFQGYSCWIVSSNKEALKNISLHADKKYTVYNGNLECSLREYKIFEGARKEYLETNKPEGKKIAKPKQKKEEKEVRKVEKKEKKTLIKKERNVPRRSEKNSSSSEKKEGRAVSSKYGKNPRENYNKLEVKEEKKTRNSTTEISTKKGDTDTSLKEKIDYIREKRK